MKSLEEIVTEEQEKLDRKENKVMMNVTAKEILIEVNKDLQYELEREKALNSLHYKLYKGCMGQFKELCALIRTISPELEALKYDLNLTPDEWDAVNKVLEITKED